MKELKVKERLAMAVGCLGDAELGRLFRGMLQYAFSGQEPTLSGVEKILWPELKEDLDRQQRGYENKVRGAEKARSLISADISRYQSDISLISADISLKREKEEQEEKQKKNGSPSDSPLQEKDIREEQEEKEKHSSRTRKQFVPPTLDEVREYVAQRGSRVDPVQFFEYFSEGHWVDAKGQPVRNWKQKLLTWEKFNGGRGYRPINRTAAELQDSYDMMERWAADDQG